MLYYDEFANYMSRGTRIPSDFNFNRESITLSDTGFELSGEGMIINHTTLEGKWDRLSLVRKQSQYIKYVEDCLSMAEDEKKIRIGDCYFICEKEGRCRELGKQIL